MDINELKKLVKNSTAVLVLDSGEPSFVILNYNTYKDLVLGEEPEKEVKISHSSKDQATVSANGLSPERDREGSQRDSISYGINKSEAKFESELEVIERINRDILALKEEIENEEKRLSIDPVK